MDISDMGQRRLIRMIMNNAPGSTIGETTPKKLGGRECGLLKKIVSRKIGLSVKVRLAHMEGIVEKARLSGSCWTNDLRDTKKQKNDWLTHYDAVFELTHRVLRCKSATEARDVIVESDLAPVFSSAERTCTFRHHRYSHKLVMYAYSHVAQQELYQAIGVSEVDHTTHDSVYDVDNDDSRPKKRPRHNSGGGGGGGTGDSSNGISPQSPQDF